MSHRLQGVLMGVALTMVLLVASGLAYVKMTGLSTRATPSPAEVAVARRIRSVAVPASYASRRNPHPADAASIRNGLEHFADHCASCHANDGSGDVAMGKGLFPPAPDMRAATQQLSDGELFYFIEHGIRFTGMPAWGTGTAEGEAASWHLVNFIRHLPALTPEEIAAMQQINPRPPAEVRQEIEAERFLQGF